MSACQYERNVIISEIHQLALRQGMIMDGKASPELFALEERLSALEMKYDGII